MGSGLRGSEANPIRGREGPSSWIVASGPEKEAREHAPDQRRRRSRPAGAPVEGRGQGAAEWRGAQALKPRLGKRELSPLPLFERSRGLSGGRAR